jgi:hypothetical protein
LASTNVSERPLWRSFIPPPFPPERAAVAAATWRARARSPPPRVDGERHGGLAGVHRRASRTDLFAALKRTCRTGSRGTTGVIRAQSSIPERPVAPSLQGLANSAKPRWATGPTDENCPPA